MGINQEDTKLAEQIALMTLREHSMSNHLNTLAMSGVVVHRCIPGPLSADPRDRQVFRRLEDLAALGLKLLLIPIESQIEGGTAGGISELGIGLEPGPREPAVHRLRNQFRQHGLLILTELALSESLLSAAEEFTGTLILDLDNLPSSQRSAALSNFSDTETVGLATEIEHLRSRERRTLQRADLVICNSRRTADEVEALVGLRPLVIPPTVDPKPVMSTSSRVVVPGRFSQEFATPDESAVRSALLLTKSSSWSGSSLITPEDSAPKLRMQVKGQIDCAQLRDSAVGTWTALAALDLRSFGLPTTARRAELMAAGIPFIATRAAMGTDDLADLTDVLISDDPLRQAEQLEQTCVDARFREQVSERLRELSSSFNPERTRALLVTAFASISISMSEILPPKGESRTVGGERNSTRAAVSPENYRICRVDGTLADADPRIEVLEAEMVPIRLYDRDVSINLQSTMDVDQKYRVLANTHLNSPPATDPAPNTEAGQVRFSILVPTWNTDPGLLNECIDSVLAQSHLNWELCIVDDGSTRTDHHEALKQHAADDPRVRVKFNAYNQGIALATNDALKMATAEWVVLLDHDDILKPDALAWAATYIDRCPDYDMWYSDEDKINLDGELANVFLKPDWSPDLLLGVNYICHLLVAQRELMEKVGGFRAGFDGAQDYDLVLRMTEVAKRVGHISKPLYSWRMIPGSTALDTGSKPKAHMAGNQALTDALDRRFEPGVIEDGEFDTTHVVHWRVDTEQLLTLMIPTRDRVDLLRSCIDRLRCTSGGVRYELLIVDNDSSDPDTLEYLDELLAEGHQVVRYPHDFSFARQVNIGALHARGDLLLILNNDALPKNDDWLLRMMEHAQRPEVGLVGARLMFPPDQRGGRPQHEGIVMGMAGLAYNIDLGGYMGLNQFVRNCSSVTAACVMLRPSVFFAVGGMDERLRVAYNDVDFGLRISEMGYRVIFTPHAELEHPESASRKDLHPQEDEDWLIQRWGHQGSLREPFVNPHLEWLMPVYFRL